MPTEKPRVLITLPEELFKQVEDYRFGYRFPSRSEAVLDLIRRGLESIQASNDAPDKNHG